MPRLSDPKLKDDRRLISPAAKRNCAAILAVLSQSLPHQGMVLEVGSGTGQHVAAFAHAFPQLTWQPSDPDPIARASISAYRAATVSPNLLAPNHLDVLSNPWPIEAAAAVVAINLLHVSSWDSALGLLAGSARILPISGRLYLYGPFLCRDRPPAASNLAFDQSLRTQNSEWGIRNVESVAEAALTEGLVLKETVEMPANNLSLVFERRG